MKQTTVMNMAVGALAALLLGSAGLALAYTPVQIQQQQQQQMMDAIRTDNMRNCGDEYGHGCRRQNSGPSAAEVDAWHRREAQVQARIARFRATPYWMALAWNFEKNAVVFPGGFKSEQRAIERAKQICTSPNCHVFATFSNTCAVVVEATNNPRDKNDLFVGINPDDKIAAQQAMRACERVHGVTNNRCFYTGIRTGMGASGTAFCVGYDYSLYNQD